MTDTPIRNMTELLEVAVEIAAEARDKIGGKAGNDRRYKTANDIYDALRALASRIQAEPQLLKLLRLPETEQEVEALEEGTKAERALELLCAIRGHDTVVVKHETLCYLRLKLAELRAALPAPQPPAPEEPMLYTHSETGETQYVAEPPAPEPSAVAAVDVEALVALLSPVIDYRVSSESEVLDMLAAYFANRPPSTETQLSYGETPVDELVRRVRTMLTTNHTGRPESYADEAEHVIGRWSDRYAIPTAEAIAAWNRRSRPPEPAAQDTERLNWIGATLPSITYCGNIDTGERWMSVQSQRGVTFRDAIDAARRVEAAARRKKP